MIDPRTAGQLTLIGAGELMPATSRLHREAMAGLKENVRAIFLDTTAGFESNIEAITSKAVEYYSQRLQTDLEIVSFRHATRASEAEVARAVATVRSANFIFAGPGSPTYALEHWRGSPVWDAVVDAWKHGAILLFASAASITMGRYALPVYEIFKAGRDPHWVEGLDLLGELGLNVAVVPHFNDNSGGDNYDSRFCYMGAARFDLLQAQLPADVTILGIDEYTGVRFDPADRVARVTGQGSVTVLANSAKSQYAAGSVISFDDLQSSKREVVQTYEEGSGHYDYEFAEPFVSENPHDQLAEFVATLQSISSEDRIELLARVESASREAATNGSQDPSVLIDLILELRTALRAASRWDLADKARDVLVELGYEIKDSREGSTWQRL
jgi:cyanophycinase-like exopeptidase